MRLGGAELDQPPVVEDKTQDVGADPPGSVGRQFHAAVRIVPLDGLHQPDVALLDQVHDVAVGAAVLVGDLDHKAKVGGHEGGRGLHVAGFGVAHGQRVLFIRGQQRMALDLPKIDLQRIELRQRRRLRLLRLWLGPARRSRLAHNLRRHFEHVFVVLVVRFFVLVFVRLGFERLVGLGGRFGASRRRFASWLLRLGFAAHARRHTELL